MKCIIVNADDFGINEIVTQEIEQSIIEGRISSTTVMANGSCLEEVATFARKHPEISFGAHICLSEFGSITQSRVLKKYALIDDFGMFIRRAIFNVDQFSQELKEAIRDEIIAQIEVLKSYNIPLSHCDSHHHVHTIYGLHHVFGDVLKEMGFTKVRIPRSVSTYKLFRHPVLAQRQLAVSRYYKSLFKTTDCFSSYSEYMACPEGVKKEKIELMCHPGHPNYMVEYKMVQEKLAISGSEIKLISYLDL